MMYIYLAQQLQRELQNKVMPQSSHRRAVVEAIQEFKLLRPRRNQKARRS